MSAEDSVPVARRLWRLLEPFHGITYFAPEAREEFGRAGMRMQMMYYLANRAAPMGPVSAGPVIAAFYNFQPAMIEHFLPRAWTFAAPEAVLRARLAGVDRAVRRLRLLDDADQVAALGAAAELVRSAVEGTPPHGRPMFAANAELPWPDEPHLALWHAATLVREHRGDGHATALMHEDVDGCEAHMIVVASGAVGREWLQYRGWSSRDCAAAEERLRERGWLGVDGRLTAQGVAAYRHVESATDRLASGVWSGLRPDQVERLADLLKAPVDTVERAGVFPGRYPPVG